MSSRMRVHLFGPGSIPKNKRTAGENNGIVGTPSKAES